MLLAGDCGGGRQMTYAFDTLGYAKRLREAGVSSEQAEAHAEAAREFVMGELVTRYDLEHAQRALDARIDGFRQQLEARIDRVTLQMTVRLGSMIAIAVAILATIIKL